MIYTNWMDVVSVAAAGTAKPNPYSTGYGSKIPTRYRIKYQGRDRRVWAMCYGNSGSLYVVVNGEIEFIDPHTEGRLERL